MLFFVQIGLEKNSYLREYCSEEFETSPQYTTHIAFYYRHALKNDYTLRKKIMTRLWEKRIESVCYFLYKLD